MNEIRRSVYLRAMGVDSYVSRRPLPGAAETRRLALLRAVPAPEAPAAAAPPAAAGPMRRPAAPVEIPRLDIGKPAPAPAAAAVRPAPGEPAPRFSLAAIRCGGWLWLEELDSPLSPQQSQLVQAMAEALGMVYGNDTSGPGGRVPAVPEASQFDWPMHSNQQLDQGEEAARAGLAAFIQRKLELADCKGLVLLGRACEERVP
ncbi:MAG: hypothetical protein KA137_06735, partial [Halioglobus sp.]|nr:hypothetical protein [Halioglobus sp.]